MDQALEKAAPEKKREEANIRQVWPEKTHAKIRAYQRQLAAKLDRDVTFEEATISYIDLSKAPSK